ncbi:MAG: ABC transporter substrate-binding protein [Acidimicrobiia bacterium]
MKHRPRPTLRIFAVATAAIAMLALSACGSDSKSSSSSTTASSTDAPKSITIGYQQIPNGDLIVKHEKLLETAFPGTTINWKLFDSGGSVNEAILAGGIDIGLVGSSPASRGISSGIPYQVPWIFDVIGKAEALVVKSGISSISDLRGKTVATPFASTAHFSLLAALKDAGLSDKDVKVIDAEPDAILAAWQQGSIDGAYVWNPNLAKIKAAGGTVLITSADLAKKGKTTYDLAVVTNDFAKKYPGAVKTWLTQQNAAIETITNQPDKAAKAIAAELNISEADARSQLADLIFVDAKQQVQAEYLGGGLAKNLYSAALFNKALGKIPAVKDEAAYQGAVVSSFAQQVAGQ